MYQKGKKWKDVLNFDYRKVGIGSRTDRSDGTMKVKLGRNWMSLRPGWSRKRALEAYELYARNASESYDTLIARAVSEKPFVPRSYPDQSFVTCSIAPPP